MKRKKHVDWFERILKIAQVVGYFLGPTILGICFLSGYFSNVTDVEAGGIKFQLGQQTGLAVAQKHFTEPVKRLTEFRLQLAAAEVSNDAELAAQAVRELDGILHAFGVAQSDLEARTRDVREKMVMQNQLQESQVMMKILQEKVAALEEGSSSKPPILLAETKATEPEENEESADDSSDRPAVVSGHYGYAGYSDSDGTQISNYAAIPYPPDYEQLYGSSGGVKKPNIFKRFLGLFHSKQTPYPPPSEDSDSMSYGGYNPYPGMAATYPPPKD